MKLDQTGHVIDADLPGFDEDGRRQAIDRSQGCYYCGGTGLALVDSRIAGARVRACSATCVCVHGRWIRSWHACNRGESVLRRMPALGAVLDGKDRQWRYESGDAEPDAEVQAPTRQEINSMFRSPAHA